MGGEVWRRIVQGWICGVAPLRGINLVLGAVVVPVLIMVIITELGRPLPRISARIPSSLSLQSRRQPSALDSASSKRTYSAQLPSAGAVATAASTIAHFPLVTFFALLFYTDLASLAGVLGCWALGLKGRHGWAALVGGWALTVRQTNVVWVGFAVGVAVLRMAEVETSGMADLASLGQAKADGKAGRFVSERVDPLLVDCLTGRSCACTDGRARRLQLADWAWAQSVPRLLSRLTSRPVEVLRIVVPYAPVFAAFAAFLRWNGGIVLGLSLCPYCCAPGLLILQVIRICTSRSSTCPSSSTFSPSPQSCSCPS